MMTNIEYSKSLLPSSLVYPISNSTLNSLIDAQTLKLRLMMDIPQLEENDESAGMDIVILAALIELKEKRGQK